MTAQSRHPLRASSLAWPAASLDALTGPALTVPDGLHGLLREAGWTGDVTDVRDAFAIKGSGTPVIDVLNAASRLGFVGDVTRRRAFTPGTLAQAARSRAGVAVPLLYLPDHGSPLVLYPGADGWVVRDRAHPGARSRIEAGSLAPGAVIRFEEPDPLAVREHPSWLRSQVKRQMPLVAWALLLTLFATLAAVANPLFVMAVYDKVIGAEATDVLVSLSVGAVLAAVFEMLLRRLRGRVMNRASLRLGYIVGNAVFGRLLTLPSQFTERASIASQIARVKDIDRIRDLLSGPLEQAILDTPFTLLFIVAVAAVGGWLAVIPVIAMLLFGVLAVAGNRVMRRRTTVAARSNARRQLIALEMMDRMRAIRATGSTGIWLRRFRDSVVGAARANEQSAAASQGLAAVGQSLGTLAALATLFAGIHMVLGGSLTTGGLIACMMLVWRLLGPLQRGFMATTRLGQLAASARQIDSLMETAPEPAPGDPGAERPVIRGEIVFNRVTFRYGRETDPILAALSFKAARGDIVAILGRNGSGKSTILKLVAGLYTASGGNIRVDGRDIRQFDPTYLRRAIAHVPQVPALFHGTIRDNFLMVEPRATTDDMMRALENADALSMIEALKDGLDTACDGKSVALPKGVLSRLALARVHLRRAPIVLLDEPATGLDFVGEFAFIGALEQLRARGSTVLLVTHRRQYLGIADKVLLLENGTSRYFGPADKIRERIPEGMI
ncbi:peptidase domain-containing ABC transporter [Roseospira visakhapatnamensis]|uniref:ABC-type bacteriocin/lantibiotic exporter with double-glycine peptidase domain n=1 Tax=Roseospira visakhapatnamensis TaxID=390880 RepID=A0A7W6RDP8_9PROT|nr:ABC transporter transmembrane domain-containing protein [Roseospira visakhapatnamensis]MBB4266588.1 ABC-type bacteriocin/lantibiotic exporter with double-glycine peptidase domain [Roseospira visakhapatnamensis]